MWSCLHWEQGSSLFGQHSGVHPFPFSPPYKFHLHTNYLSSFPRFSKCWTPCKEPNVTHVCTMYLMLKCMVYMPNTWCALENVYCSAQLCPTLWDPMDCSRPGSSVHGIFHARIREWVNISFSRSLASPALAAGLLTTSATWEARPTQCAL